MGQVCLEGLPLYSARLAPHSSYSSMPNQTFSRKTWREGASESWRKKGWASAGGATPGQNTEYWLPRGSGGKSSLSWSCPQMSDYLS